MAFEVENGDFRSQDRDFKGFGGDVRNLAFQKPPWSKEIQNLFCRSLKATVLLHPGPVDVSDKRLAENTSCT